MKKLLLYLSLLLNLILILFVSYSKYTEKSLSKYMESFRYERKNVSINPLDSANNSRVVFIGNSIIANWINLNNIFFSSNNFINRGIGGETSSQILLRFQRDVISLKPSIVVLNTGINDIGKGDGFYRQAFTISNVQTIIDVCKANNIILILTSVLPATEIKKNRFEKINNVQAKIEALNQEIEALASVNHLKYVNYNSALRNKDGTFDEQYTFDGVHPNEKGYSIMEKLILETINN